MSEMVGELLNWFYGISSELKFAVVSGIVAAIGAVIFGVAKAIAWKVDHNPSNQGSGGMPTQAVGELLEDRDKRHSKEKSKLKRKMGKLKTASDDEKRTLEAEIAELRRRENNRGQALKDEHKTVSELKPILAREGNALGGDAFEKLPKRWNRAIAPSLKTFFTKSKTARPLMFRPPLARVLLLLKSQNRTSAGRKPLFISLMRTAWIRSINT